MPALSTEENRLRRPVSFVDTTASGTGARSIARVNRGNWHARALCFVLDKVAQLSECPRVENRSLAAPSSYPLADMRQFFQRNAASGVFGGFNDSLTQDVVNVGCEAVFLAGKQFQPAFGRLSLSGLQLSAQAVVTVTNALDRLALVDVAVAINSNVGNAKVNTKEAVRVKLWRFFNVAALKQVELALAIDKIALTMQTFKQLGLVFTADKRHLLAPYHCPDRDNALGKLVGDKSVVERESSQWLECPFGAPIQLVGVGNFGKDAHSNVSAKVESFPNVSVAELMQGELPERSFLPSAFANVVAGGISSLKCALQGCVLFLRRLELDLSNQLHVLIVPSIGVFVKTHMEVQGYASFHN